MFLFGGISKTKNNMEEIKIIPAHENLESFVEEFRNRCLALKVKNSSTGGIFLMTLETFEKAWNDMLPEIDISNNFVDIVKQNWIDLIGQKRIVVVDETNIKNLVDIL